jgi:hypothetical protein
MRPPGPRPESKSVTATPRAARSDAQTAPVTAMEGRGNGDHTRQFERILQERGELGDGGRDGVEPFGCLLPPPMTATLATLMAQCLPRCVICLGQFRIVSTCRVVDRSHPNRAMVYFDTSFPFTAYIHFTEIHMYFHCKIISRLDKIDSKFSNFKYSLK